MKNKLLLVGGGGHARVVLDTLLQSHVPEMLGMIDPNLPRGTKLMGVTVLGGDEELGGLYAQGWHQAMIGVGSVTDTALRRKLTALLTSMSFTLPSIIDALATVSQSSTVGCGVYVGKRAVVQPGVSVGHCCILNTGCIVEHDCTIGEFTHISPGSVLLGGVKVGTDSLVGGGSVVRQGIRIGDHVTVGAGSVVVSDLPDHCVAYGNPCKVRKR